MKTVTVILIATALQAAPPTPQVPPALKEFLETQSPTRSSSRSVDYRVAFKSFHSGKPTDAFLDSGVMHIGTTEKGSAWISAPAKDQGLPIGELSPPPEGQRWFNQLCDPSGVAPFANPGALLGRLVNEQGLKGIENPTGGIGDPGDLILVYRLEAPRPVAKFWVFQTKVGEARLRVRKDGVPVSLDVGQAYEGELSPHFGIYSLNRKESWTFSVDAGRIHTVNYRLTLRRQDWENAIEAEVEMADRAFK